MVDAVLRWTVEQFIDQQQDLWRELLRVVAEDTDRTRTTDPFELGHTGRRRLLTSGILPHLAPKTY